MKKTTYTIALLLSLGCCGAQAADSAEVLKAISAAEAANQRAASVGGEWRDAQAFIKQAKDAATRGDYETALKRAQTARVQGELGHKQALAERNKKFPPAYMR